MDLDRELLPVVGGDEQGQEGKNDGGSDHGFKLVEKWASSGGAVGPRPAELPLGLGNEHIVDARESALHEAVGGEFPILVAVGAIPLAGRIVKFVLKAHGDTVGREGPEFLLQAVVEFSRPLAPEQFDDRRATVDKFGAIAPFGIFRVGQSHALGIAAVPTVFGELDF